MKNSRNCFFLRNVKAVANHLVYKRVREIYNAAETMETAEKESREYLESAGIANTSFFIFGWGNDPVAIRNTYLLFGNGTAVTNEPG